VNLWFRTTACFAAVAFVGGCSGGAAPPDAKHTADPAGAATVCTSAQQPYPQRLVQDGRFSIEPDRWNASAGTVCLKTPGDTGFTVSDVHGLVAKQAKAPLAYPNIATVPGTAGLPVPAAALGDATSDWSAWPATSGSYDMAYDLWYGPSRADCDPAASAELMIWLDATDTVAPAGSRIPGTVTLGDSSYAVHTAPSANGAHSVISYVRTDPTRTVRGLDLRLFTADALQRGYVPASSYLCKVAAGFEIWSGGVGLRTFSFAFHNSNGLPTGVVRSGTDGICLVRGAGDSLVTGGCGGGSGKTEWTAANDGTVRTAGRCLQAAGESAVLAGCNANPAQRWTAGAGRSLHNVKTGGCLTTANGSLAVGAAAALRPCHQGAAQHWRLPYNGLPPGR
jgi:hypothetical protein